MKFSEYKYLIFSDLYRVVGNIKKQALIRQILFGECYKYNFWLRTCCYSRSVFGLKYLLYPLARMLLNHYTYKYGISIPCSTKIGSGFYIGHFGGIVINGKCAIGKNCTISQGVTLGKSNRGKKAGYPILGDNVYIGAGAKVIGGIMIGDNVAIGANSVVTNDAPANSVVVGIPGRVISQAGSYGYVNRTDYGTLIR